MISHRILPATFGDVASGKTNVANGKSLAKGSCDAGQRSISQSGTFVGELS